MFTMEECHPLHKILITSFERWHLIVWRSIVRHLKAIQRGFRSVIYSFYLQIISRKSYSGYASALRLVIDWNRGNAHRNLSDYSLLSGIFIAARPSNLRKFIWKPIEELSWPPHDISVAKYIPLGAGYYWLFRTCQIDTQVLQDDVAESVCVFNKCLTNTSWEYEIRSKNIGERLFQVRDDVDCSRRQTTWLVLPTGRYERFPIALCFK